MNDQRILIVGVSAGGALGLPQQTVNRITSAHLLVGGRRQLAYFPDFAGERLEISNNIDMVAHRLQQSFDDGQCAVVLSSGDPMWYGIGASLRRYFPPDVLEVVPAPTSCQLAFAALAETWHDAMLLNAHGRPLEDVIRALCRSDAPKTAILTDNVHTPAAIARALISTSGSPGAMPLDTLCAVCENLGSPEQHITRSTLAQVVEATYAPLNVFIIWRRSGLGDATGAVVHRDRTVGLPDEVYSTSGGLITKREVRLLILAELSVSPSEVLWDIGAGSGAVAIEAARSQPRATVYAIEQRSFMINHLRQNAHQFAPGLHLIEGTAPQVCADLPDPDAVFVGGSGGRLRDIITMAQQRLRTRGRLVLDLVTLENLQTARACLPEAEIIQVQINRAVPILGMLRFEARNPVFIMTWRKQ